MNKIAAAALIAAALVGCTSTRISQDLSAGKIGCPAREITIIDEEATISGTHTFIAACRGKQFSCSYHSSAGMACSELMK